MRVDIGELTTEQRNPTSTYLDRLSIHEMIMLMNQADKEVPIAVAKEHQAIERLIELAVHSLQSGGRIIYIGAGTSGRLGILDASEAPPTFGVDREVITGLIAGGVDAILVAVEGAEDDEQQGEYDLKAINLTTNDIVIGLAASGRTPYVIGGLKYARRIGAHTGSISAVKQSKISQYAHAPVEVDTGPEILTGSTRLKAGTAQKLILNMISTISMVKLGKVYQNFMVDLMATNDKLKQRSISMLEEITQVSTEEAELLLKKSKGNLKAAIIMELTDSTLKEAEQLLVQHNEKVYKVLEE